MKKILGVLALFLGVLAGIFVVISRIHKYKLEAIQKITLENVNAMEKLTKEEYDIKVGEAESELMSATVDEVVDGFRERFGVKR